MSIASEIQRIQTAKAGIRTALDNLGFDVPQNALLSAFPENIVKTKVSLSVDVEIDDDMAIFNFRTDADSIGSNAYDGESGEYGLNDNNIVIFYLDGIGYFGNLANGRGSVDMTNLEGGSHDWEARIVGTSIYSDIVSGSFEITNV